MTRTVQALIACLIAGNATASENVETVAAILASAPCSPRATSVVAYLQAGRHGAWLSDTVGSHRSIGIDFAAHGGGRDIEAVRRYVWRPQDYLRSTFRAKFHGALSCPPDGANAPALRIDRVEEITISRIADANP